VISKLLKKIPELTKKDEGLIHITEKFSMTPPVRIWCLIKSIEYLIKKKIKGDFVECGVWRGGNLILMQKMLNRLKNQKIKIYGYDTFTGLTMPSIVDRPYHGRFSSLDRWKKRKRKKHVNWCYAGIDLVKQNILSTVPSKNNIKLIEGKVEDTLLKKSQLPKKIALLRLDTDWYKSTKTELEILYPLLSKGGVLIIDDYGHWKGARKAVDEYFKNDKVFMHRIDYSCRLIIK
jgi:hypothetical protein